MKLVTIQDLRRQLAAKERLFNQLQDRRKKVLAELAKIDISIQQLNGGTSATVSQPARKRGPKAGAKAAAKRSSNTTNLVEAITDVLAKSAKPMRVKDVQNAVTKAGYKSSSKQFYTIVATALRDPKKFKKAGRGLYQLAK